MDITTLLTPKRIRCEAEISSKKRAFEQLATMLAADGEDLDVKAIFDALISREKLGCTALGNGVALPHASCTRMDEARGALLIVEEGIKMDAPDKKPVHLLMAILVPEDSATNHSELITELASKLSQKTLIEQICNFNEAQIMLDYLGNLFLPDDSGPELGYVAA